LMLAGERPKPRATSARENNAVEIHVILLPPVPPSARTDRLHLNAESLTL